ncbi:flagellar biosynthetic protein FliO [Vibrio mexicanus]|uniref:flagellar biosynthetic protein FliO n=1 Tax=Vibrio mexicanus TaxID=1004326 RepID=UPI00063C5E75|nr:flagellar biosynthetic protein FliO [Vibrio mexicanus]
MKPKWLGLAFMPSSALATTTNQIDLATTFGSLLFVIAFIFFIAWLLKRMRVPTLMNQKGLSVVRQLPVGTKERLMIVQAGDEQFLVGVTAHSINMLSKLEKPLTQEELETSPFSGQLSQLLKKNDKTKASH